MRAPTRTPGQTPGSGPTRYTTSKDATPNRGTYTHHIGSAHICDRNAERVRRVLHESATVAPQQFPFPAMPTTTTPSTVDEVLVHEELLRTDRTRHTPGTIAELGLDPYWQQVLLLFEVYRQIQHEQSQQVSSDVLAALDPGLRWLVRHRWPACAAEGGIR